MSREAIVAWLLEGDPAIRWQTLRDLSEASDHEVTAARTQLAVEGWGADLLARQDADGRWAGALYSPKWTSTTYTLLLLHWLGLAPGHPQALVGCLRLWDGARCYAGGLNLGKANRKPKTCIRSRRAAQAGAPATRAAVRDTQRPIRRLSLPIGENPASAGYGRELKTRCR